MTYHQQRGPNVSQYLANLNAINPPADADSPPFDEQLGNEDLSIFTNTQFFDFDIGDSTMNSGESSKSAGSDFKQTTAKTEKDEYDFGALLQGDINFDVLPMLQDDTFNINFQQVVPLEQTSPNSLQSPTSTQHEGVKRKASADLEDSQSQKKEDKNMTMEEASRQAAEEDKRRRNTAASARFRIKKKQREQAMELHNKELEQKCQALESRVNQLEMENKWLKNLVVEKNGPVSGSSKGGADASQK